MTPLQLDSNAVMKALNTRPICEPDTIDEAVSLAAPASEEIVMYDLPSGDLGCGCVAVGGCMRIAAEPEEG